MLHLVRAGRQIDRAVAVEIPRVLADVVLADAGDLKGHRHRHDSLAHVGLEAERERGGVVFVRADVDRAVHDAGKVSKVQGWRIGHLRALVDQHRARRNGVVAVRVAGEEVRRSVPDAGAVELLLVVAGAVEELLIQRLLVGIDIVVAGTFPVRHVADDHAVLHRRIRRYPHAAALARAVADDGAVLQRPVRHIGAAGAALAGRGQLVVVGDQAVRGLRAEAELYARRLIISRRAREVVGDDAVRQQRILTPQVNRSARPVAVDVSAADDAVRRRAAVLKDLQVAALIIPQRSVGQHDRVEQRLRMVDLDVPTLILRVNDDVLGIARLAVDDNRFVDQELLRGLVGVLRLEQHDLISVHRDVQRGLQVRRCGFARRVRRLGVGIAVGDVDHARQFVSDGNRTCRNAKNSRHD